MHDVIIDDTQNCFVATTQMEERKEKLKKEAKPKRKERLAPYLIDWLEKALVIASLISLNFLIYVGAGSYDMFSSYTILTPEVWYILSGIIIFSILIIYCVSFFKLLQNLLVAAVAYYFVIAMLNQFAVFDKSTMLAGLTATYISQDLGILLSYVSHIVVALVIAGVVFLFMAFASKLKIFWFLVALICINILVIFSQLIDANEHQKFNVLKEEVINAKAKSDKKFIYIGLQGLGSYAYLDKLAEDLPKDSPELPEIKKTQDIMLGFYAHNNFIFYPQSYVEHEDAAQNYAKILNSSSSKTEDEYLLKNVYPESFWKFNRLNEKHIYLKESRLYDAFKKSKFSINAYQSSDIELCKINNEMAVHRCVERNASPIDFDNMNISAFQKTKIIMAQWLESMQIFDDFSIFYKILRPISDADTMPLVGMSYKDIDIKNSADVLDLVVDDLNKTNGNTAYFINMDLPHESYIFDEFCQVKPTDAWSNKKDLEWSQGVSTDKKRKAYMQQVRCLYGKLQKFVDNVNAKTKQRDTVIFIQGLSGLNGLSAPKQEQLFLDEFMNKNFVDSAVKDPLKKDFQIKIENCSASDILNQYLYRRKQCQEFNLNIEENLKKKILEQLHTYTISTETTEKAKKDFADWYKIWQEKQGKTTPKVSLPKIEKKAEAKVKKSEKKEEIPNKNIKKAPEVAKDIPEEKEEAVKPLSQAIKEETVQEKKVETEAEKKEEKTEVKEKDTPSQEKGKE